MSRKEKHEVVCPFDGHVWKTKSKLKLVTCPSCGNKVPNPMYGALPVRMEHFNLGEDGVRILDHKLNWIVDVYFKPKRVFCEYDRSSTCEHVKFALSLPQVQAILKQKGWKLD